MGNSTNKRAKTKANEFKKNEYDQFDQIDGSHPWKKALPDGFIDYPVRVLENGQVTYFNFDLAKEMGLVPANHPDKLNSQLNKKLLETFCLRIINEYDEQSNVSYHPKLIKKNKYMATRYLQLQHENKQGKTSGDGRCIWNGFFEAKNQIWDISSRGTGVTALAPGSVLSETPLQTGNTDHGYGCGLAEVDELYSAAIMSEIFHRRGLETERMLAIIETADGYGIGVRAGKNLIRPAHLFLYLKQNRWKELKSATDYLIERQFENNEWNINPDSPHKYQKMLEHIQSSMTEFLAKLDREYIFMWLDWDGDNVLANSGIIDYGSIRQFGLRHDQYRYDDVERLSTTLNEQFSKGKLIFQVYLQLVDFIKTREKKPLKEFKNHPMLDSFEEEFRYHLIEKTLFQSGFEKTHVNYLLINHKELAEQFFNSVLKIEKTKTKRKLKRVDDGFNRPALFDIKKAFKALPDHFLNHRDDLLPMDSEDFFGLVVTSHAQGQDKKRRPSLESKFEDFQNTFIHLIEELSSFDSKYKILEQMSKNVHQMYDRPTLTGNGLIFIVDELLSIKTEKSSRHVQRIIDHIINEQSPKPLRSDLDDKPRQISSLLSLIEEHEDSI